MKVSNTLRNAQLSAILASFASGKLRLYNGVRPANPDTALSGNTLLAELTMGSPAFAAPSAGSMVANAIVSDANADNSGTATFARCYQSDGTTALVDLNVGVGIGDVQIATTLAIVAGSVVSVSSWVMNAPVGST